MIGQIVENCYIYFATGVTGDIVCRLWLLIHWCEISRLIAIDCSKLSKGFVFEHKEIKFLSVKLKPCMNLLVKNSYKTQQFI